MGGVVAITLPGGTLLIHVSYVAQQPGPVRFQYSKVQFEDVVGGPVSSRLVCTVNDNGTGVPGYLRLAGKGDRLRGLERTNRARET